MELAVPSKPLAGVSLSGMPPEPSSNPDTEIDILRHPPGPLMTTSSFNFWDWHSYIIIFLVLLCLYHLWTFRVLYLRLYNELARSIRDRVFNAEVRVNLEIRTPYTSDTTTVVLNDFAESERLNADTIEIHEILEADDQFLDCLENP